MSRRSTVPVLVAAALALACGGTAIAQVPTAPPLPAGFLGTEVGPPVSPERTFRSNLTIDPSGPYEVKVGTSGSAVVLTVSRGRDRKWFAATRYLARGVAVPERLQATFGRFGRVSMRFHEAKVPRTAKRSRCRGTDRFAVRRGVFVGNLRFRGEDGYLTIRAHRAKGSITARASRCLRRDRGERASSSSSLFEDSFSGFVADDANGVDSTAFVGLSFRERAVYYAQREEARGKLSVLRIGAVAGHGGLPFNESLTAGRFSPGSPFHGTGRYRAAPDGSTSWSGNLSVDFPGAPHFPLAGPGYETFLEAGF